MGPPPHLSPRHDLALPARLNMSLCAHVYTHVFALHAHVLALHVCLARLHVRAVSDVPAIFMQKEKKYTLQMTYPTGNSSNITSASFKAAVRDGLVELLNARHKSYQHR